MLTHSNIAVTTVGSSALLSLVRSPSLIQTSYSLAILWVTEYCFLSEDNYYRTEDYGFLLMLTTAEYGSSLRRSKCHGCGHVNVRLGSMMNTKRHSDIGGAPLHRSKKRRSPGLMPCVCPIVNWKMKRWLLSKINESSASWLVASGT